MFQDLKRLEDGRRTEILFLLRGEAEGFDPSLGIYSSCDDSLDCFLYDEHGTITDRVCPAESAAVMSG